MSAETLEKFSHLQTKSNQALAGALLCCLPFGIHIVDSVCCRDQIFHVILGIELVVGYSRVELQLITVGRVQVRFDPLEVAGRVLSVGVGRLVVLNHESQVNQRPQLQFILVHPEVRLHTVVLAAL